MKKVLLSCLIVLSAIVWQVSNVSAYSPSTFILDNKNADGIYWNNRASQIYDDGNLNIILWLSGLEQTWNNALQLLDTFLCNTLKLGFLNFKLSHYILTLHTSVK
jgi:hypothetical protein